MPLEMLWLLLPVAAASGWFAARRHADSRHSRRTENLSPQYFEGLNYLLNEQQDKAIEVFVKMAEVDSETIETHLALGNLFRRRGEVDRAIRIHYNLIARTTLSIEQRTHALLELGQDYMRAGLLDRAEELFKELIELDAHSLKALQLLSIVFETEKDWKNAILTARQIEAKTGGQKNDVIAHYFCEMADEAREACDFDTAKRYITNALSIDRDCVRASILEGEIERGMGNCHKALQAFERVERQDPGYLDEVIIPMYECYRDQNGLDKTLERIAQIHQRHGGLKTTLLLTDLIRERRGNSQAISFISGWLDKQPSLKGALKFIEIELEGDDTNRKKGLSVINNVLRKILETYPLYKCHHCGFSGHKMHWQCPSCKIWNGIRPVQGLET